MEKFVFTDYSSLIHPKGVGIAGAPEDYLPRTSPLVGFMRHSPPSCSGATAKGTPSCSGAPLRLPLSKQDLRSRALEASQSKRALRSRAHRSRSELPRGSPYMGPSNRLPPPSPTLNFLPDFRLPPAGSEEYEPLDTTEEETAMELELEGFMLDDRSQGVPDEAWLTTLAMVVDVSSISAFSRVARGFSAMLKSDLVWAGHTVQLPPAGIAMLAPHLKSWLPAWRFISKLVIPRSTQLLRELSEQAPHLPIEVAWRFDSQLKGQGVEVVNHGKSVRRIEGADEELVVLGDAPLPQTAPMALAAAALELTGCCQCPYLEVILDDRSAVDSGDAVNDFGIGVTARPPSDIEEIGSVADEIPLSWVVDFTKHSIVLSVNNMEAAKGSTVSGEELEEGDRVGLRVTLEGTIEIYINGKLRDHLVPDQSERVPLGVELFPVLDLYGCTVQLTRTYADKPSTSC